MTTPTEAPKESENTSFQPDILGEDFQQHTYHLGKDPDGESNIAATVVRYFPEWWRLDEASRAGAETQFHARPALLLIHGMTDYFFQTHVAEHFHAQGYAVYALDLRKCGRSWREGQTWHHVTDQALYDAEMNLAAQYISHLHPDFVAIGHSTGGLFVAGWAQRIHETTRAEDRIVQDKLRGVLLNSPWLDLQVPAPLNALGKHLIPALGHIIPNAYLPAGVPTTYGRSVHQSESGRWDYDLRFKPLDSHPKRFSWLAGVVNAQLEIQTGEHSTGVPTLILSSNKKFVAPTLKPETFTSDIVLWPEHMQKWAGSVDPHAQSWQVTGAIHDVFLSQSEPLDEAFSVSDQWLDEVIPAARI